MSLRLLAVLVAVAGAAPAGAPSVHKPSLLRPNGRPITPARELAYEVAWWTRADETPGLPFRPIENGGPAVNPKSGEVFVGTADLAVHALSRQGKLLWEYQVGEPFDAGLGYFEGRVYVAGAGGSLLALDAASGKLIWKYQANEELLTRPMVAGGLVLVMSAADTLFAVDALKGDWKWQYRREPPGQFTVRGAAQPLWLEGKVYAGFADGFAVALDAKDGGIVWAKELAKGAQFIDVDAGPVSDGQGNVIFGDYASGIFSVAAASGALRWSVERPGASVLAMDGAGGRVYAGGSGYLAAFDAHTGKQLWSLAMGERYVSGLTWVAGSLLASTGTGPLLVVAARDGRLRGSFDPGHGVSAAAAAGLTGQAVVLSNRGYVYQLDMEPAP